MQKPGFVLWSLVTTVLAGCLIMVLLLIPAASARLGSFILGAVALSAAVAWPASRHLARSLGLTPSS